MMRYRTRQACPWALFWLGWPEPGRRPFSVHPGPSGSGPGAVRSNISPLVDPGGLFREIVRLSGVWWCLASPVRPQNALGATISTPIRRVSQKTRARPEREGKAEPAPSPTAGGDRRVLSIIPRTRDACGESPPPRPGPAATAWPAQGQGRCLPHSASQGCSGR